MVERSGKSASRAKALHCEVQSLKTVRHPNVLKLLEVVATEETSFIVSELVSGGDLLDHIRKSGPMAEDEARGKFRQLASALEYCHRKGVVHRDLRLEHVLLDGEGNVKLSGFGSSAVFLGQELSTQCGSPWYAAPETLQGRAYAGPPADVWSLGVVLFFLLTGAPPFWGCDLRGHTTAHRAPRGSPRVVRRQRERGTLWAGGAFPVISGGRNSEAG
uniref:non-specific serine/threonine protein kinase n=1 Tax=Equus asinus TaxID=9793 RepID=A0A9L0J738_EQUAS